MSYPARARPRGFCVDCGDPVPRGFARCDRHRYQQKLAQQRRWNKKQASYPPTPDENWRKLLGDARYESLNIKPGPMFDLSVTNPQARTL